MRTLVIVVYLEPDDFRPGRKLSGRDHLLRAGAYPLIVNCADLCRRLTA
jgi:hypothetical protein